MTGEKYNFQKLTPNDDVDIGIYENAIDYAFENPDVKNVAISGAYSAGKSSILASYKKKHKKLRFIHISLAHFNEEDYKEKADTNTEKESILEGKILNQLIHQISPDKIPQTDFKIKKNIGKKKVVGDTIFIVVLILSILHIKFIKEWSNYIYSLTDQRIKSLLELSIKEYSLLVSNLMIVIIAIIFLYRLLIIQNNKNIFRKFKLQGNEIELFQESNESYFDKYLNEVLYVFDNSEADVIVFEDIDRFNVPKIFERLREINILINIKREKNKEAKKYIKGFSYLLSKIPIKINILNNIKSKKNKSDVIRFFYLLRDDIFISKDRTKFFDYIIPIIPVLDGSNSYNEFIKLLKGSNIYEKFNKNFLQGISLYIDDMRLLKNIYNEFIVYYSKLKYIELDYNKMLAIITYKNLFPRDFSNLQLNRGFVYTLFENKHKFMDNEASKIKNKINQKKNEINYCEKEHLLSLQELEQICQYKQPKTSQYYQSNYSKIKKEFDEWYENQYPLRKQAIINRENNALSNLNNELNKLEKELSLIKNKQLSELITRENIDEIFKITSINEINKEETFNEIKGSNYFDLLKYLIRNGYIDETYSDYMTYFIETSLSRTDKIFLRSITDKKAKSYEYKLKNPDLIVENLCENDFTQEEILNFDLLDYILRNSTTYFKYLNTFLCQLSNTKKFEFISKYLDANREVELFTIFLNKQWPDMFSQALRYKKLTEHQLRLYSINSLYFSDDDDLKKMNTENVLCEYISNCNDYLNINTPNIKKIVHAFQLLNVKLKNINYDISQKELFKHIYENSLYEINFENICLMLKKIYLLDGDIIHKNYTMILKYPKSPLSIYMNNNFETYINIIIDNCKGIINDEEAVALSIINKNEEELSLETRKCYIKVLKTHIKDITLVKENSLKDILMENSLIAYSEKNIIEYFKENELNSILVDFINRDSGILDFSGLKDTYGEDIQEKFSDKVIVCENILNKKYKEIIETLNMDYTIFNIPNISTDKFRILIDSKIICMNLDSLNFIRENYTDHVLYFIDKNLDEYIDIIDDNSLRMDELLNILSGNYDISKKMKLLSLTDEPISIYRKSYPSSINNYILEYNIDTNEILDLIDSYDEWEDSTRKIICKIAINKIDYIIDSADNISILLIDDILNSEDIVHEDKCEILISRILKLSKEKCKDYFDLLELYEFEKLFEKNSKPKIKVDDINNRILQLLKKKEWIEDFKKNPDKEGYYKITKKKEVLI